MTAGRSSYRDPHYWVTTKSRLWCALGAHDVSTGTRVRYRRNDYRGLGSCEDCLRRDGIIPPRPVTLNGDGPDVRAKRAGND